jgi:hypothetical protein
MRRCFPDWLRFAISDLFSDRTIRAGVNLIGSNCGERVVRNCRQRMGFQPQRSGGDDRIDPDFPPPCGFVAATVDLAMVSAAERDGELIADFATECPPLREPQMVGIRGLTAADQARVFGHLSDVLPVPNPAGFWKGQGALVYPSGPGSIA